MRAVNLIPGDSRSIGGGGGSGPYVLLGVLGVLLVGVFAYVLTNNSVVEQRAELASLTTQARAAQAQAEAVRPYREFAELAEARVQTVRELGATRFDWHRAFTDLTRVMPDDVWLTALLGTVTTGVAVDGGSSGSTSSLRSALPNPAIELTGCTTSQDNVARLISRLRLMTGVVRVSLADSTKDEGGGVEDCRYGNPHFPQFGIVVFFEPLPAPPAPPSGSATGAATTSPDSATAQPAASASPSSASAPSSTGSAMR